MIRVLEVGVDTNFGGIESFLLNVAQHIDHDRFDLSFVSYGDGVPSAREDEFRQVGTVIHPKDPHGFIGSELMSDYDIVHIHKNSLVNFRPVISAVCSSAKVIVHAHNTTPIGDPIKKVVTHIGRDYVNRRADMRLTCSDVASMSVFGTLDGVETVHNGIDLREYAYDPWKRGKMRARLVLDPDTLLIGCVGRLVPQKNQKVVIDILRELAGRGIDAVAVLIGDGPDHAELERQCVEAELVDRIVFTGAISNVEDYLQAMDVMVMPSLYEGLPLTAIEGQASGLPLVVSDVVTREIDCTELVHRVHGYDVGTWCDAVLLAGGQTRKMPHTTVLDAFDVSVSTEELEDIYASLSPHI